MGEIAIVRWKLASYGSNRFCDEETGIVYMVESYIFFFHKAPLPIASPKFIMNLTARISHQSGDCQDKIY